MKTVKGALHSREQEGGAQTKSWNLGNKTWSRGQEHSVPRDMKWSDRSKERSEKLQTPGDKEGGSQTLREREAGRKMDPGF